MPTTRYQQLPIEEEEEGELSAAARRSEPATIEPSCDQVVAMPEYDPNTPSPPYEEAVSGAPSTSHGATSGPMPHTVVHKDDNAGYVFLPPPYGDENDLPSYEEVRRMKEEEDDNQAGGDSESPYTSLLGNVASASLFNGEQLEIGSDSTFLLTFMISLMFSWVGFMLTFCVSNSLAGRYGAISGFGLSLVKWTIIMTHSEYVEKDANYWANAWVWWLMILMGMIIFVRGIYLFVRAKQLTSHQLLRGNTAPNANGGVSRGLIFFN